jgi:hypothetical protein
MVKSLWETQTLPGRFQHEHYTNCYCFVHAMVDSVSCVSVGSKKTSD